MRAGGTGELAQFLHRIGQVPFRDAVLLESYKERALGSFVRLNFNHSLSERETCLPRDPFNGFCRADAREIQWLEISLMAKPGQLSFGITPRRLLDRGDAFLFRNTTGDVFADLL